MKNVEESFGEELTYESREFQLPKRVVALVTLIALPLIVFCVYAAYSYFENKDQYASPSSMGLSGIFLFSLTALICVWVPWSRLGVRITKIGGVEFERILNGQASEHAEEIAYLQERIEALEHHVRHPESGVLFEEILYEVPLREALMRFLNAYSEWAFSPSRIKSWGSAQPGFNELGQYEHAFIRSTLQKMVADGTLETRISKRGNTLYRVPRHNK